MQHAGWSQPPNCLGPLLLGHLPYALPSKLKGLGQALEGIVHE